MSAAVVVFGTVFIFLAAATVALVLSRASRERVIRREIAAEIRAHAEEPARFRPDGEYVKAPLLPTAGTYPYQQRDADVAWLRGEQS